MRDIAAARDRSPRRGLRHVRLMSTRVRSCKACVLFWLLPLMAAGCHRDQPTSTPASQPTASALHEGHALLARRDFAGASTAFQKALQLQPDSDVARLNLALSLLLADRSHEAVEAIRPLLSEGPVSRPSSSSTQVLYLYGLALM